MGKQSFSKKYVLQDSIKGSFTNYVTQCRWVGLSKTVTLPMILEKFYYAKVLIEVGGWSINRYTALRNM